MHEISVGKHTVRVNNFQFCTLFFFCLSGLGFLGACFMVILDIARWSYQS